MLVIRTGIVYDHAEYLADVLESIYNKYKYNVSTIYLIDILNNVLKISIKYIKAHQLENIRPCDKIKLLYEKFYRAKIHVLPLMLSNYDKILEY